MKIRLNFCLLQAPCNLWEEEKFHLNDFRELGHRKIYVINAIFYLGLVKLNQIEQSIFLTDQPSLMLMSISLSS